MSQQLAGRGGRGKGGRHRGVELKRDQTGPAPAVKDEPDPAFEDRVAEALANITIVMPRQLAAVRAAAAPIVEAEPNKIVYEI